MNSNCFADTNVKTFEFRAINGRDADVEDSDWSLRFDY
jgi:hypothetical protein